MSLALLLEPSKREPRRGKNSTNAHGFARQKGQEVMDERLAFNACLKIGRKRKLKKIKTIPPTLTTPRPEHTHTY